jgi:hypothetical protein
MSANFLDTSGAGIGCDNHLYFAAKGPLPDPKKKTPHLVASKHAWVSKTWRIAPTVTTRGRPVLQSSWAMLLIPHCPLTLAPPHPAAEGATLAAIFLTSSSTPLMSVHAVSGQGQALETSIAGLFGINVDCGDMPFPGVMVDLNENTVKTSPTLGDLVAALFSALCAVGYAWAVSAIMGDLLQKATALENALASIGIAIVQTILDILSVVVSPVLDPINALINWLASQIQAAVDSPASV